MQAFFRALGIVPFQIPSVCVCLFVYYANRENEKKTTALINAVYVINHFLPLEYSTIVSVNAYLLPVRKPEEEESEQ